MSSAADVVIIGAGTAGCVLAERLSLNPSRRVLVLTDGDVPRVEEDFPSVVRDAQTLPSEVPGSPWVASVDTELRDGRIASLRRGRIAGGSSAVNGCYFIRGTDADFARWESGGIGGWDPDTVRRHFISIETDADFGSGVLHGDSGPVWVERSLDHSDDVVTSAFVQSCRSSGMADQPDKNAGQSLGVGPVPRNVRAGVRQSTALTHLLPALHRPNLEVRADCAVGRVIVRNGRAVGVQLSTGEVAMGGHVVLCAGSIRSAQLLLLSGVGPESSLRPHGIDVVQLAPGVGSRFSDHPCVELSYRIDSAAPIAVSGGMLGSAAHVDTAGGDDADVEILAVRRPYGQVTGQDPTDRTLSLRVTLMRAHSRGSMGLTSADPTRPPALGHHLLSDPRDRQRLGAGVRSAAELLRGRAFDELGASMIDAPAAELLSLAPGAQVAPGVAAWLDARVGVAMHLSGTVPMGSDSDPHAVLDQRCQVRGVDGLSVIDASSMPTLVSRGPAATVMMMADRAAEFFD